MRAETIRSAIILVLVVLSFCGVVYVVYRLLALPGAGDDRAPHLERREQPPRPSGP